MNETSTPEEASEDGDQGRIPLCPHADCGFRCCQFNHGNYIVMFPGELAAARAQGHSTAHLEITAEENGGHRAVCRARDTGTCDNGYKPLDCASYPFFPLLGPQGDSMFAMIRGAKCPLPLDRLDAHASWVQDTWQALLEGSQEIRSWLGGVELVGYELVPPQALLRKRTVAARSTPEEG